MSLSKKLKPKAVAYENNERKMESVYSKKIKAGKRRTYFFDVRETRGNDYFLTITESRKKFNDEGYERHKVFLYKEDFNKFVKALNEAVEYVKTELMPGFDFDAFNHDYPETNYEGNGSIAEKQTTEEQVSEQQSVDDTINKTTETPAAENASEDVDKW